jgi:hypothetical protein
MAGMGVLMIDLTKELIRKHRKLIEVTVKQHTAHSKKGRAFNVKQHERKLQWAGSVKKGDHLSASGYTIKKTEFGFTVTHGAGENVRNPLGEFDTVGEAKATAQRHFNDPNYRTKPIAGTLDQVRSQMGIKKPPMSAVERNALRTQKQFRKQTKAADMATRKPGHRYGYKP